MSTAEPTPAPASASFGPVGERKGSVPSGDERLSPYLVAAARVVAAPAPRVPGRADCGLRSVAQSVTTPKRSYSRRSSGTGLVTAAKSTAAAFSVQQREAHLASTRPRTRRQIGEQLAGKLLGLGVAEHRGIRAQVIGYTGLATGKMWVGTPSTTRKQRCATYPHACERFSAVSDERPAPRPRCAAGTGGSRADRRTTRPACRPAQRQCPSVHPAAQWCALRRRPTDGRR